MMIRNHFTSTNFLKVLVVGFTMLVSTTVSAATYYIDNTHPNTNNDNSGLTPDEPWTDLWKVDSSQLDAQPGDTIAFKRGNSWVGNFQLFKSGTAIAPILITSYGTGALPQITNTTPLYASMNIYGSYVVIENFKFFDIHSEGISIRPTASHVTVQDCVFEDMGIAITVQGRNNLVTRNIARDLRMVRDENDINDYGAVGFGILGDNNEFSYNTCMRCIAPSRFFGSDGGGFEIWGHAHDNHIHHNWVQDSNIFLEAGGNPGSVKNLTLSYNVAVNNQGGFVLMHRGSPFQTTVENVQIANNTIVQTEDLPSPNISILRFGGSLPSAELLFQNNVVMLHDVRFVTDEPVTRRFNLYHFLEESIQLDPQGGRLAQGEIFGDPQFVRAAEDNFHLSPVSLAIDHGENLGFTLDFDNQEVPKGNAPDLGAYESLKVPADDLPGTPINMRIIE